MRCRSWTRASASTAIVYCADTSNEGHLGHPGRVLENVKMLAEASQKSSKPYYLMSSRPGLMNTQQVKALREQGWSRSAARARASARSTASAAT